MRFRHCLVITQLTQNFYKTGSTPLSSLLENVYFLYGVIPNRKPSASDWRSRDCRLDSRFHGNDTFFVIPSLTGDPFGLDSRFHGNDTPRVILNRKPSASDWGSRDCRLDSRFHGNDGRGAGMTHPLSSSTESEALRIGDLEIADWIPVFTGMTEGGWE